MIVARPSGGAFRRGRVKLQGNETRFRPGQIQHKLRVQGNM